MIKFIVVSLMLIIFSADCFGLKCYFCKDKTNGYSSDGPCPDGAETEVKDCTLPSTFKPACYITMVYYGPATTGPRLSLGCIGYGHYKPSEEFPSCTETYSFPPPPPTSEVQYINLDHAIPKLGCSCITDLCNIYTENDFKCIVCTRGGVKDNLCSNGEKGEARLCPMGLQYCKTAWISKPGEKRKYYKGCAKLPPAGNNKFTVENSVSCRIEKTQKGVIEQECYCASKNCNNKFEENALWCYVCTQDGGRNNLCRSDEEGEKKRCPTGMKYCYSTWVIHPDSGLGRVYYKGCVKELPAGGNNKFQVENSVSCRVRIPEKGKVTQECYCQSDLCNGYIEDLPIPWSHEEIFGSIETKCNSSIGVDNTFVSLIIVPVILHLYNNGMK